jgi:class 3 adenylate cyclase/predicted ATPase
MQQIADWLEKLGMSEYAQRFAENRIDFSVLRELTDQDLKELGVLLGDRRKMLRAIADIDNIEKNIPAAPAKAAAAPRRTPVAPEPIPTTAPPPISAAAEAGGERRYVTVMFCDLVGSTGISSQLDAEEWRDLVSAYLEAASTAITEVGGHVAKKLGDGLMVLFGYPVAQENDAERAARAAVSIQRALAEVNRKNADAGKPALHARIGIETGPVVIDAAGEVYGDAPNIAARVQALAEPGTVVMTARVQHQVAGLFVVEERGSRELKGVPEPVTLYRLVRASGGGRRAGQRHLTPLVGREEEIAMLMRRWERARQGDGQLVMIVGEPGLGKSRLIEEFHLRLREVPHTWVEWSCSQLLQNTPLHPLADWGRQRFGGADIPAEQRIADLENTLALVKLDPAENAPLLAPLLDVPLPQERASTLAPEELRRRQLAALTNWVMAGARTQPAVLALEDVHWADPTTLDVLRGIAERGALVPLFVLITARPEFRPPWGVRSHHSTISLAPLDRSQVRQMIGELAARHALPKEVVDGVTERTGGVPLFVEEVTRLFLERERQGAIQAIPPTLQQSLTARLDRLGPAREVAQIGAVIGRDFSYALLRAVAGTEDVPLQTALERLAEADILLLQGLPPDSEYRFKHALIQDAAYENLLISRRQVLHRRVGEALRDNFAATAAAAPELVAHHFTQARLTEAAIEWWGKAGHLAAGRSTMAEAAVHFIKALQLIASLPKDKQRQTQELALQLGLAGTLMAAKGWASPQAGEAYTRARELCRDAPEGPQLVAALSGLATFLHNSAKFVAARQVAEELIAVAGRQNDRDAKLLAHRTYALNLLFGADFAGALRHLNEAVTLYERPGTGSLISTPVDPRIASQSFIPWSLLVLGYADQAIAESRQALEYARELSHPYTLAYALHVNCIFHQLRCDGTILSERSEELVELATEQGFPHLRGSGRCFRAWATIALEGSIEDAISEMRDGLAEKRATGAEIKVPYYFGLLAEAHRRMNRTMEGLMLLSDALELVERTGEHWYEAELYRLRGEMLIKNGDRRGAEPWFSDALATTKKYGAKLFELRAAMSLARLWRDQGKVQQARELLAPVYGWFTEGFDTRDLKEAKALLAELAS